MKKYRVKRGFVVLDDAGRVLEAGTVFKPSKAVLSGQYFALEPVPNAQAREPKPDKEPAKKPSKQAKRKPSKQASKKAKGGKGK